MIDPALAEPHAYKDSVTWRLTVNGVEVDGTVPRTPGQPATVRRVWADYGPDMLEAANRYQVPVELIVATIATESGGKAKAIRKEPGYKSDSATPHRISTGLMQTLISTAREALHNPKITRAWLMQPLNSILAGTAYIAQQKGKTNFDPPKVAAAYNAGGVYHQKGAGNRWKMRQYPIGTGKHCDRFVAWFNDCIAMFRADGGAPAMSFTAWLDRNSGIPLPPDIDPDLDMRSPLDRNGSEWPWSGLVAALAAAAAFIGSKLAGLW